MDTSPSPASCEFFPLPSAGADPFFAFGRSWWLQCEKDGHITFRRTKRPGHRACRVEIPYADAKAMIESFQKTN